MFFSKLSKIILKRSVIVGTAIFLQLLFLAVLLLKMASQFVYIYTVLVIFSLAAVVYIVGDKTNPSYKLSWSILILAFPLLGGVLYLLFGTSKISWSMKKSLMNLKSEAHDEKTSEENLKIIGKSDENIFRQMSYTSQRSFPVYKNSFFKYFSSGEEKFDALKNELKKARKYIFMEYFIISKGKMWSEILEILKEKVKNGVEVRIIYDDCGCKELKLGYDAYLRSHGIKCRIFNPLRPSLSVTMNNRDHRKIVVIDGETGFTGGINLGDEYINLVNPHGHWKDCAVMIKGQAVKTFIHLFLEMWDLIKNDGEKPSDFYGSYPELSLCDGFVQPYGVEPFNDPLGENIYLNMINKAKSEILIYTPYLILTDELTHGLALSAQSGVKVKIITPGIADKPYVHILSRAYYPRLIRAGVEIYEYTPGFIHGKLVICDGELASIGTVNFDYRSLFLHFECGTLLYNSGSITEMRKDFYKTAEKSHFITLDFCERTPLHIRIARSVLRLFAPLM